MEQHLIGRAVEKGAAAATVSGGAWMSYEAIARGLNMGTAVLGFVAAVMAIVWWFYKIRNERKKGDV